MEENNKIYSDENYKCWVKIENEWFLTKDKDGNYKEGLLEEYESICLIVYTLMLRNLTTRNTIIFNLRNLYNILKIDYVKNTAMTAKIKRAIEKMSNGLFTIYTDSDCKKKLNNEVDLNSTYYCLLSRGNLDKNFIILYDYEVDKIIDIEIGEGMAKGTLLTQMAYYAKSFGGDKEGDNFGICFPSLETIKKNTLLCEKTVINNNERLRTMGLLLYGSAGINIENGTRKDDCNVYARPFMQEKFDLYITKREKIVTYKNDKTENFVLMGKQRSLKQKINDYVSKLNKLGIEDINDLFMAEHKGQYDKLHKLEMEYYDLVVNKRCKKIPRGTVLITIKANGEKCTPYDSAKKEDGDCSAPVIEAI